MSNKVIKLTEKDLESIIEKVISEQYKPNQSFGQSSLTVLHGKTGKESKQYYNDVAKKMDNVTTTNLKDSGVTRKDARKVNADEGMGEQKKDVTQDYNYGLQNLRYDTQPSKAFKERQEMAIKGHSKMGNENTEATEMTEDLKDPKLGEKIINAAKARYKAEAESPYNEVISLGDDIEKGKASKKRSLAFEGIIEIAKEKLLKEGIKLSNKDIAVSLKETLGGAGYGFKQESEEVTEEEVVENEQVISEYDYGKLFNYIKDSSYSQNVDDVKQGLSDLADEAGKTIDQYVNDLKDAAEQGVEGAGDAYDYLKNTSYEQNWEDLKGLFEYESVEEKMNIDTNHEKVNKRTNPMEKGYVTITDEHKATHDLNEFDEKTKNESIGEKMYKRLKYSTDFESADQALTLIPEHHKIDGNMFQLTDNNNYITVRWEGDKKTGEGVVLLHKNTKKMNESTNRMKQLMGYSFGDKDTKKDTLTEGQSFKKMMDITRGKVMLNEQPAGEEIGAAMGGVSAQRTPKIAATQLDLVSNANVAGVEIGVYRGEVRTKGEEEARPIAGFKPGDGDMVEFFANGALKTEIRKAEQDLQVATGNSDVRNYTSDLIEKLKAIQPNIQTDNVGKWFRTV